MLQEPTNFYKKHSCSFLKQTNLKVCRGPCNQYIPETMNHLAQLCKWILQDTGKFMSKILTLMANFNFHCQPEDDHADTSFYIKDYEEILDDLESKSQPAALQGATLILRNEQVLFVLWSALRRLLVFCLKCEKPAFFTNLSVKTRALIVTCIF